MISPGARTWEERAMSDKKAYSKPRLTEKKIELGVYGSYRGGDLTAPLLPVENKPQGGKLDLHG